MAPSIGGIVHYVMPDGAHRPAVVVEDWPQVEAYREDQNVNLIVTLDGDNDRQRLSFLDTESQYVAANSADGFRCVGVLRGWQLWATSVPRSDEMKPGTWHWPERKES